MNSVGSQLAALRPTETKPCAWCGQTATKRIPWLYCSKRCQVAAWRHKHKQEIS